MRHGMVMLWLAAGLSVCTGCRSEKGAAPADGPGAAGATAQCDLNTAGSAGSSAATSPDGAMATRHLHNVFRISPKLISGAAPDSAESFEELGSLGVKTVISVDGATPDVAGAAARGMRYVHIPITYAEVTEEQALELARAVRDLPGPIYIHCHHGKHRSPAAAAVIAVGLGVVTPEEGVAFMKRAGTGANYAGLYACAADAVVFDAAALDAAPAEFPSVRRPKGITAAMVEIDGCYERLGEIRRAGWKTPSDHPDLVPVSEAGQLADHYRQCGEDARGRELGADFARRLSEAVVNATALEAFLEKNAAADKLEKAWAAVAGDCKGCHAAYRDQR